jgi:hypothetical protein
MRGIFWNGRGLLDLTKCRFLADTSRGQNLLETDISNFTYQFLGTVAGGLDYFWHCLPPQGRSGGILLGVNSESLKVLLVVVGNDAVKFHVRSKIDGFRWPLIAVYGAAQSEFKHDFLADQVCGDERLPIMVGGDFIIIQSNEEKNV